MEDLISSPFYEFAAILIIASIAAFIGRFFKQPLIVSFIIVGILVGPYAFDLIESIEQIHLLAELGIAVLLFAVGLKLDLTLIKSTGRVALLTGMGQVFFTSVIGYMIGMWMGYSHLISLYIAVALTFSSTIIIVKLLSDKKEIDSLHGQISIGFLIVQDIVVVLVMIFLSSLGLQTENSAVMEMVFVFIKGIGLLVFIGIMMKYILPALLKFMSSSQELLILFSIAWALTISALGDFLGFSKEVGAFLAGISIASSEFREIISGKLTPLRDFLLLFFFISLGSSIDISILGIKLVPAIIFSAFVLIGNPIIVLIIMGLMGYRKRTSFLAGLTVAQISEFSLILAAMGLSLGHIDNETMGLITLVGLITIGLSTYLIIYSHQIFEKLSPLLNIFERPMPFREAMMKQVENYHVDVVIFGLGRYGTNIAQMLKSKGRTVMGVDFDPKMVDLWKRQGKMAQLGDAEDPDLPTRLPLKHAKIVISTLPDYNINLHLLKFIKAHNFQGKIVLTQHYPDHAQKLIDAGADLILFPFVDAAENIIEKLNC